MSTMRMEGTITRFRRELFDLVNQAMAGAGVGHAQGPPLGIEPEKPKGSKLARLTKRDCIN